jgi:hypothetical protein
MLKWWVVAVLKLLLSTRFFALLFPLLLLVWVLLVLYPNPWKLVVSVQRVFDPGIDPVAVEPFLDDFSSDPAAIEAEVLEYIPYTYDWENYGMPWYCPTADEVLARGTGDCKARAIVLASILEARGIPYRIDLSPVHMWVDYEGKAETSLEREQVKFYQQDPETGERSLSLPQISFTKVASLFWQGFWEPMPGLRKGLLLCGLAGLIALRLYLWLRRKRSHARRLQELAGGQSSMARN